MTFLSRESSRSLGMPDTLVRFTSGTNVYAYTDSEEPITFASVEYKPIPVSRDAVTSSGTLDKSTMKIQLPIDSDIAELFRIFPPSEVVGVAIFQGHADDGEFLSVWSGRVLSCARGDSVATLACEPVSTSMRRPGLRRRYQYGCPHVLYGPYCRANQEDFTVSAGVAEVDGTFLTMDAGWHAAFDPEKFSGGIMAWDNGGRREVRIILDVVGDMIMIGGAVSGLDATATIQLSLGCAHTMSDCSGVFANINNFGGHPWIPSRNPISPVNFYD